MIAAACSAERDRVDDPEGYVLCQTPHSDDSFFPPRQSYWDRISKGFGRLDEPRSYNNLLTLWTAVVVLPLILPRIPISFCDILDAYDEVREAQGRGDLMPIWTVWNLPIPQDAVQPNLLGRKIANMEARESAEEQERSSRLRTGLAKSILVFARYRPVASTIQGIDRLHYRVTERARVMMTQEQVRVVYQALIFAAWVTLFYVVARRAAVASGALPLTRDC